MIIEYNSQVNNKFQIEKFFIPHFVASVSNRINVSLIVSHFAIQDMLRCNFS